MNRNSGRRHHYAAAIAVCAVMLSWSVANRDARAVDVPFVPTPAKVVDAMLAIAKVGANDFLIDLGSGDGRIVIAAAKRFGTRGFGVDIDGALVSQAEREARRQGVSDKVAFYARNLFITDIRKATVITMYLFPQVNMRLRPRLLTELKPGTRIVSHDFDLDNWRPDDKVVVPVPDKPYGAPSSDVYLWIVPANGSGSWRWQMGSGTGARDYEIVLEQRFQMLSGRATAGGQPARLSNARMRGDGIEFALVARIDGSDIRHEFAGRIAGDAIVGTAIMHAPSVQRVEWRATRVASGKMNIEAFVPSSARENHLAQERQ
jgi:hypothetical protein